MVDTIDYQRIVFCSYDLTATFHHGAVQVNTYGIDKLANKPFCVL